MIIILIHHLKFTFLKILHSNLQYQADTTLEKADPNQSQGLCLSEVF